MNDTNYNPANTPANRAAWAILGAVLTIAAAFTAVRALDGGTSAGEVIAICIWGIPGGLCLRRAFREV